MKVFLVMPYLPFSGASHGTGAALYSRVISLSKNHDVYVAAMYEANEKDKIDEVSRYATVVCAVQAIEQSIENILAEQAKTKYAGFLKLLEQILRNGITWFLSAAFNRRPKMKADEHRFIDETLKKIREIQPDIVQVEYTHLCSLISPMLKGKIPCTAVAHDVVMKPLKRKYRILPFGLRWFSAYLLYQKQRCIELNTYADFDKVYVVSNDDLNVLLCETPRFPVSVLPSAVLISPPPSGIAPNPNMILFVGAMYREENIEGVRFIINKVMPLILKRHPKAEFHIVGGGIPTELQKRHDAKNIFVHGYVKDLSQFYGKARVMAVPLFTGGGLIIKLFEALSYGVPTVATPIANEGIASIDGKHLLLASTPEEFSAAICHLLVDDNLCTQLSDQSKQFVQATMNLETITANLVKDYESIIANFNLNPSRS
jgi:glycosyltransferase involved in cell wall biosynthesis